MASVYVSVIIVTYNVSKFIGAAIDSVLNQNYKNFEIIVVDDGSTDDTLNILSKYKDIQNINILEKKHSANVGHLRNEAINISKGEFVAFLDSDDVWDERKLSKQIEFLDKYDFICSNARLLINTELIDTIYFPKMIGDCELHLSTILEENYIITSSVLARKTKIIDCGLFEDKVGIRGEDYILWLNFLKQNTVFFINEPLIHYRKHSNNLSFQSSKERVELLNRIVQIRSAYIHTSVEMLSFSAKVGCANVLKELTKIKYYEKSFTESKNYAKDFINIFPNKFSFTFVKYVFFYCYLHCINLIGDKN